MDVGPLGTIGRGDRESSGKSMCPFLTLFLILIKVVNPYLIATILQDVGIYHTLTLVACHSLRVVGTKADASLQTSSGNPRCSQK